MTGSATCMTKSPKDSILILCFALQTALTAQHRKIMPLLFMKNLISPTDEGKRHGYYICIGTGSQVRSSRDWRIETRGRAIKIFNDSEIQSIGSRLKLDLTNNNYAAAAESFANICDEDITAYNERTGGVLPPPLWIAVAIVAGIVVAFVIVHSMKSKLKTVKMQAAAGSYLKSGSLNITQSNDIFLYSNVTRTAKPKENSSSGSSTHTSSSGNTYGGGGGKF